MGLNMFEWIVDRETMIGNRCSLSFSLLTIEVRNVTYKCTKYSAYVTYLHTLYSRRSLRSLTLSTQFPSTVSSTRNQHRGQVTTTLQEHQMTLLKCHEDLRQHHQNEKSILQELQVGPIWADGDRAMGLVLKKFEIIIADVVGLVLFYLLS